jgi:hypothetical protein
MTETLLKVCHFGAKPDTTTDLQTSGGVFRLYRMQGWQRTQCRTQMMAHYSQ